MRQRFILLLVLGSVAGPALARIAPPPAGAPGIETAVVVSRLPTSGEKFSSSIDGTYWGSEGTRGSLLAGLLLGPVGVLANQAHVQHENGKNAAPLAELTKTNLTDVLRSVIAAPTQTDSTGTSTAAHYELVPVGILRFWPDLPGEVSIGCSLQAYLVDGGKRKWKARYEADIGDHFPTQATDSPDRGRAAVSACLDEAYRLFVAHVAGKLEAVKTLPVQTLGKTHNVPIVAAEQPTHVILPDAAGFMELGHAKVLGEGQ